MRASHDAARGRRRERALGGGGKGGDPNSSADPAEHTDSRVDPAELPRLCLCTFHVALELLKELTQSSVDPFTPPARAVGSVLSSMSTAFKLGEQV